MIAKSTHTLAEQGTVRPLYAADVTQVAHIESLSMAQQAWSACELRDTLQQPGCHGLVLEVAGNLVGYLVYERQQQRGVLLLRVVVAPSMRRRGYGSQLVRYVLERLGRADNTRTPLEFVARETALGVQLFARSLGLRAVRVLPAFYEDTAEDGYWFQTQQETQAC